MDVLQKGRTEDLSKWILALPEEAVQGNPWLLLYLSMTRRFAGKEENLLNLPKALNLFEKKGDVRGRLLALAFLIEASILRGRDFIPLSSLLEQAENLLASLKTELYPYERAMLWLQMCFGLTVRAGNPRKGFWASQNAYLISRKLGEFSLQVQALVNAVQALCWLGEFALVDEKCKTLEKLVEKHPDPAVRLLYHTARCESSLFRGEFKEARELIKLSQNEAERHGLSNLYPVTLLYDLMLRPHFEQYKEAEEIGNHLLSFSITVGNSFMTGLALLFVGRNFYYEGDYEKAKDFLHRSLQHLFSDEVRAEYHVHLISVLYGFISCHIHQNGSIEEDLQRALDHYKALSSFVAMDAHFAMALLKWNQGNTEEATEHIEAGLKISKERGYYYFPMTSPRDLVQICVLSLELEVRAVIDYAAYLLTIRIGSLAEPELKRLAQHSSSTTRKMVWDIRKKIHQSKVPRLRIETLGGFRVFRGDSLIKDEEWDRIQPKELLKLIVSYGAKGIPKEALVDQLWPEERPRSAESNFKTTLQRLRKSLEPDIDKDFGSSYIYLHDNRVILDQDLCQVDAVQFLSLIKNGEEKEKASDVKGALSLYTEAMELYKGDFLPEEVYLPEVDRKREELKGAYIDLLQRSANLHERRGALRKAIDCHKKAIQADPLFEESYQKLMTLYSSKGLYNEAIRTYEACKKAVKAELKTKPDPMTTALYNKVLEKIRSS
jgi:LuxR family maltose regulon positive regulatory protein